jgi:hypothetical protein
MLGQLIFIMLFLALIKLLAEYIKADEPTEE